MHFCAIGMLSLVLAACSGSPSGSKKGKYDPKYGVSASARVASKKSDFRKGGGHYKVGKPYKVAGKTYVPKDEKGYVKTGKASWYGDDFHGRLTANGEIFDMHTLTAAHPTLPLPSYARVTNLKNGRSVIVRINDRGPYAHNRVIDLSKRVAEVLAFKNDGITTVKVKYIGKARMDGKDARYLEASFRKKGEPIGDDFRAVPKEGERFTAPEIMVASAKPTQKKKSKEPNYLMAHVAPLGSTPAPVDLSVGNAMAVAPSPEQLASAPMSGWAPIDLVGDGYFPPDGGTEELQAALVQLAQMAPVQLNYAEHLSQRVASGHEAIASLFKAEDTSNKTNVLASKLRAMTNPVTQPSTQSQNTAQGEIGSFEPAYALRLAEEFAALAAVDMSERSDGQLLLSIKTLKPGVSWDDISAMKRDLGLSRS